MYKAEVIPAYDSAIIFENSFDLDVEVNLGSGIVADKDVIQQQ